MGALLRSVRNAVGIKYGIYLFILFLSTFVGYKSKMPVHVSAAEFWALRDCEVARDEKHAYATATAIDCSNCFYTEVEDLRRIEAAMPNFEPFHAMVSPAGLEYFQDKMAYARKAPFLAIGELLLLAWVPIVPRTLAALGLRRRLPLWVFCPMAMVCTYAVFITPFCLGYTGEPTHFSPPLCGSEPNVIYSSILPMGIMPIYVVHAPDFILNAFHPLIQAIDTDLPAPLFSCTDFSSLIEKTPMDLRIETETRGSLLIVGTLFYTVVGLLWAGLKSIETASLTESPSKPL